MAKVDITSTALEKTIDLARSFLSKLIAPAIEETGLLLKDQITMWKFNNQVRMLNKAMRYCEKNSISPKSISLKLLCPLLENAALEEDEKLQEKWAVLLSNMVDSDQNIENHVFPYILSQISNAEFSFLERYYKQKCDRVNRLRTQLDNFQHTKGPIMVDLTRNNQELKRKLRENTARHDDKRYGELRKSLRANEDRLTELNIGIKSLQYQINEPQVVSEHDLKPFELANIVRLGLVKYIPMPYANSQTLQIPNERHGDYLTFDLDVQVESDDEYVLTELGELFVSACMEKV